MTSTFLGKWRFSFQWAVEYNNYIIYGPERRSSLSDLYTYTGPAIKATNFAFIRGSDSKLYFQMNNGKYVQCSFYSFRFADTLAEAANFSFPGHEQFDPPTSFRSEEHTSELQSHSFISYAVFFL